MIVNSTRGCQLLFLKEAAGVEAVQEVASEETQNPDDDDPDPGAERCIRDEREACIPGKESDDQHLHKEDVVRTARQHADGALADAELRKKAVKEVQQPAQQRGHIEEARPSVETPPGAVEEPRVHRPVEIIAEFNLTVQQHYRM